MAAPTRPLMDRLVAWSPVLLLGGLAALTWWLDAQINSSGRGDRTARHEPDVIVGNFRAVILNDKGRAFQRISAREARHYPDDGMTEFLDPALVQNEQGRPELNITAERGRITSDRENAYFEGHVRAVRDAEKGSDGRTTGPITMTTEYLHVLPKENVAKSDRPVTITEPRGIIHANGFVLDDRDKTIVVRNGIRGTIEAQAIPTK